MTERDTIAGAAASLDDPDAVMPEPPAPDRIWLRYDGTATTDDSRPWETNPYVRADLIPAMLQDLQKQVEFWQKDSAVAWDTCEEWRLEAEELRALIDTPAPSTPAEPAWDALRTALADMANCDKWPRFSFDEVQRRARAALAAAPAPQPVCCLCDDRPQAPNNPCGACGKTAPQPVPGDREALVEGLAEIIRQNLSGPTYNDLAVKEAHQHDTKHTAGLILDALLARGLRLPTDNGDVK